MCKKIEFHVSLRVLALNELLPVERTMLERALAQINNSHAPYSDFLVCAALLLENGEIFVANNQENVSFPVGVCAERAVLSYAMSNFPDQAPLKILIVAKRRADTRFATVTPCGLCRQTLNEYETKFGRSIEIIMYTPNGELLKASGIDQLLPFRFNDLNS
ncbi:MAG: cytidine deaminase [Nitritalea sp.]